MPYTVQSSERTRSSTAEYETKALLYLMNFRPDSNDIYYFVVDFFNDLTGMDRYSQDLWDVQSKGEKNNSPGMIGKALVTLFKNFLSDFTFKEYILFLGGISSTVRKNGKGNVFKKEDITDTALSKIVNGLKAEATKKTYINNSDITDSNIRQFLEGVTFVLDDKSSCEYVKAIIKDHPAIIPEASVLNAIFNEIRNAQSALKNTVVEGVVIQATDEVLRYCRHLTNSEIRLMVLSRIINRNPVEESSIPPSFNPIFSRWPPEKQRENLDHCIQTLCRALFNKNAAPMFWRLFESIYSLILEHPTYSVEEIFRSIDEDIRNAQPDFETVSLQFFIAQVKDGIQK